MRPVTPFSRLDTSHLGRWWWSIDRWMLSAVLLLVLMGVLLTLAAGPATAERVGFDTFHFVRHQFTFLPPALVAMLVISFFPPGWIRRIGVVGTALGILLVALTLVAGPEVNGARRWLGLGGFHLQPSEFLKPCLAVALAVILTHPRAHLASRGMLAATALTGVAVLLLGLQPDIGMAATVGAVWFVQAFLAGVSLGWIALGFAGALAAFVAAYKVLPHVEQRIDGFLNPGSVDSYQVDTSLRAFETGGIFGRGPGEGVVKSSLPDAHTDFIFAVAGEELGVIVCIGIIALFAFIVLRTFVLAARSDLFALVAVSGLISQFGLQAAINMGVAVRLLPAKGMTLPLLSYGGSSMMATAIGLGMVLALTRSRRSAEDVSV